MSNKNTPAVLWGGLRITDSGCWEWRGAKNNKGYGSLRLGKEKATHRIAWTLVNGPVPDGVMVLHRCDNPPCCNPWHLFLGDARLNSVDMFQKGRDNIAHGERSGKSKLKLWQVKAIRELSKAGMRSRDLATRFAVSRSNISKVVRGYLWTAPST